ncbi:hypothetical protein D6C77_01782 [Aureobasidium pullulans]|nr:hypothetical protein D6C77_01782 [Aureobasidium pullulans]
MSELEVEKQTYYGNCHCGAFKYSIKLAPMKKASRCNCRYLFAVPEKPSDFKVEAGESVLKTYSFGNGIAEHKFCPTCGSGILVEAAKYNILVININTLKHGSFDIDNLEISTTDRVNVDPIYEPFTLSPSDTPEIPEGQKLYTGSCHCQAIKYTLTCPEIREVRTCNCSFCSRNADMWIYPPIASVDMLDTEKNLTNYLFHPKRAYHGFCSVCGVDVVNRVDLHPTFKAPVRPINVRTIDGLKLDGLDIDKADGWSMESGPYKAYNV